METIQDLLKLKPKWEEDRIREQIDKIAKAFFNRGVISNGTESYELLEIEFYIVHPNFCDVVTYKRDWKKPGELFYHYSGIDICFASDEKIMGGILVRSVHKIGAPFNEGIICGPLKLKDVLLNNASQKLEFTLDSQNNQKDIKFERTNRINVPYEKENKGCLRFVRKDYHGVIIVDNDKSSERLRVNYKVK